ncbi:MAG: SDR family oxidoreductase [Pseudomonadota bacterium]
MDIKGKNIVITGAAHGIGAALAKRFRKEGAGTIALFDRDMDAAEATASEMEGIAYGVDMSNEAQVQTASEDFLSRVGDVHLVCSNAGVAFSDGPDWTSGSQTNKQWEVAWQVNVMASVYLTRAFLPGMRERGDGYFLITSSAAGLLSQVGDAAYSTTKHAAIGYAESLAISHGDEGIKVSALCPQGVETRMTEGMEGSTTLTDGKLPVEDLCDSVMAGLAAEQFMILPHPQVADYVARKVSNYDRWVGGMRKLRRMAYERTGRPL